MCVYIYICIFIYEYVYLYVCIYNMQINRYVYIYTGSRYIAHVYMTMGST